MRNATWFVLGVVVLAGCGDIIGLNGYTDEDGSVVADTGTDTTQTDAQADGGMADVHNDVVSDTGPDVTCQTPAFACVPPLPTGWAWAVYAPDTRAACSSGYGTPLDVEEGIDASAAGCSCGCNTTQPSCTTNKLTITAGTNGACNNVTNQTAPSTAGCNNPTSFATNAGSIAVTGPTPSGGSCTPDASATIPPVGYAHQGRTCALAVDAGGGCAGGNVCVPSATPFTMCVAQLGTSTCPSGFPNQHLVGTTLSDTRGCAACTCAFDAGACTGSSTFYSNNGCSNNAQAVPVSGVCTTVGNHTWRGYTYTPTTNGSCAPSTAAPDGGVVFSDLTTVCCE